MRTHSVSGHTRGPCTLAALTNSQTLWSYLNVVHWLTASTETHNTLTTSPQSIHLLGPRTRRLAALTNSQTLWSYL